MCRHVHASLGGHGILAPPQAGHSLLLGVELEAGLAIKGIGTTARNTLLVAGKAEHGKWHGDWYVDTDLAGLDLPLEASCCGTRTSKDGGAVAVLVGIDHLDGVVDGFNVQADKNRSKDFFAVAAHMWFYVGDDCRANLFSC